MQTFKDNLDRSWDIVVNVGNAKRVRSSCGVDIFKLYSSGEAERLFNDPCLLVDTLFVLCQKQCEERGVKDEDFGSALVGDSLTIATDSLLEAVADFFPTAKRMTLRKMHIKAKQITDQIEVVMAEAIDKLESTFSDSPTNSQA